MRFGNLYVLPLLLLVPLLISRFWGRRQSKPGSLRFSRVSEIKRTLPSGWSKYYRFLYALRILAITLLIVALARPQSDKGDESITTEGIDIIMTLDVSGSM